MLRSKIHRAENSTLSSADLALNKVQDINKEALKEENIIILAYSLRKIKTKPTEAYSILKPDTSSDSPSEKSNGVRLVSATDIINQRAPIRGLISIIGGL